MHRKILCLIILVILSGCQYQKHQYCFYEKEPFKVEIEFDSELNQLKNIDVLTTIDLQTIGFNQNETEEYIAAITKNNPYLETEYVEFNHELHVSEHYDLNANEFKNYIIDKQLFGYQKNCVFNHDLTIIELEKMGFNCQ